MIELRTGIPGSGKTLSMVQMLAKLLARWESKPDEVRPIFVHGIPDLALSHSSLPVCQFQSKSTNPIIWVPDWEALPEGALVIIDEAQGFFPPRSSQSTPPPYVAWLNTHRHKGIDLWLTTQHPKLIDTAVRALVGKHQHYRRLFGGARSAVYEFDGCNDSLSNLGSAVISYYPYPKQVYKWYKSAETHTKQSFRLPKWIIIPVLGAVLGVFAIPKAYTVLHSGMTGNGLQGLHVVSESSAGEVRQLQSVSTVPVASLPASAQIPIVKTSAHPFDGLKIVFKGSMSTKAKKVAYFDVVSDSGVQTVTDVDLVDIGYQVKVLSPCLAVLIFGTTAIQSTCGDSSPVQQLAALQPLPAKPSDLSQP